VGDSRLYHFRAGELADVGPDDSAGWAAYARGEIDREGIRLWDGRSHLTAALGVPDGSITPHCGEALLAPGEAFLACSDGLWQYVWDVEMQIDLAKSATARQWLNLMLERLVARSQLDGDNLTALAVHIKE
jgi:serine/threonine protein phosphatase PrpC